MGKRRACDVCSLRKIRCDYAHPCSSCTRARFPFQCSYAKKPQKPGPKGPRRTTSARIEKALLDIGKDNGDPQDSRNTTGVGSGPTSSPSTEEGSHRATTQPPRFTSQSSRSSSPITLDMVSTYLDAYSAKMYAVWPVVDDPDALIAELDHSMIENETLALTFSICAATGVQLRLKDQGKGQVWQQVGTTDCFASEAERVRKALGSRESPSLASILIPFFLHVYNYSRNKKVAAALCLREALTLCELLDLDKEQAYESLPYAEQVHRRKIFWLLFVTERGKGIPSRTVLRPSIALPLAEDDKDPTQFAAFLRLVQLFIAVDDPIFGSESRYANQMLSIETLARLQQDLSVDTAAASSNEVQRTDLAVTQHWLRMLLWQVAVSKISMTAGEPEDPFSLRFPSHVAKDALEFLSRVSMESVIPHGVGIETKIFEIASTLLDVINVVPSQQHNSTALIRQEPREIFRGLSSLLASLSDGNSHLLTLLQSKIAQSQISFTPLPRLLEIDEEGASGQSSTEAGLNITPRSNYSNYRRTSDSPQPIQIRGLGMSDWVT